MALFLHLQTQLQGLSGAIRYEVILFEESMKQNVYLVVI